MIFFAYGGDLMKVTRAVMRAAFDRYQQRNQATGIVRGRIAEAPSALDGLIMVGRGDAVEAMTASGFPTMSPRARAFRQSRRRRRR